MARLSIDFDEIAGALTTYLAEASKRMGFLWKEPVRLHNTELARYIGNPQALSSSIGAAIETALKNIRDRHGESFVVVRLGRFYDASTSEVGSDVTVSVIDYYAWGPTAKGQ